ncbi:MAG TPA: hypothetical protein VK657_07570, partial [Terriglobales bacterium]|nr:hypothetical protein [Terriglobales bacterium]
MISLVIYISAAILFSLAAVFALGTAMEIETRWRRLMVPALYALILLYSCIARLIYGRDLYAPDLLAPPSPAAKWFTRLAVLTTLTVCVARILAAALSRENRGAGGGGLLAAFGLFFLTNTVLNSALGTQPQFSHDQYYVLFLFGVVYASRTQDVETALR